MAKEPLVGTAGAETALRGMFIGLKPLLGLASAKGETRAEGVAWVLLGLLLGGVGG